MSDRPLCPALSTPKTRLIATAAKLIHVLGSTTTMFLTSLFRFLRINSSSANYKGGYNAGYSAGQSELTYSTSSTYYGPFKGFWAGNIEKCLVQYTIAVTGKTATLTDIKVYCHFNGQNNDRYWESVNTDNPHYIKG